MEGDLERSDQRCLAGYYGVPVGLVTGDDKAVREARRLLGAVETVEVKKGRACTRPLPVTYKSRSLIYDGAKRQCLE